mmetsp:Transcript_8737/g.14157  ORF Transcript_8737/g.14157 Transcript_8737/m.14157 type:complete len:371 (+) Transcript_8737:37-1149(+)
MLRRCVVGMSGGVDSSVAAHLLKSQNQFQEVIAVFMKNWDYGDEFGEANPCPIDEDYKYASQVCDEIGIKLHRVDFVQDYWNKVFEPYLDSFNYGTPNPDIFCNKEIKFKSFKNFVAKEFGNDCWLATGHYARLRHRPGCVPELLKGRDPLKDQSYFLSAVAGEDFRNVLFPVGELEKTQVREIASRVNLCTAKKKDSVGICFIGKRNFGDFIGEYIDPLPGRFKSADGKTDYGEHPGIHKLTIGQKARIQGVSHRFYVLSKCYETNTIYVGQEDDPMLFSKSCKIPVEKMFWVAGSAPGCLLNGGSFDCSIQTRYRNSPNNCTLTLEDQHLHVHFHQPEKSLSPMQIGAFYVGDVCLGGGIMTERSLCT